MRNNTEFASGNVFTTTDIAVCAYFVLKGVSYEPQAYLNDDDKFKVKFLINTDENPNEFMLKWVRDEVDLVSPRKFRETMNNIRSVLFREKNIAEGKR